MKKFFYLLSALCCFIFLTCTVFAQATTNKGTYNPKEALTVSIFLFIVLVLYTFITWLMIGRDPIYLGGPSYEPPENISPAFTYYLYNEIVDERLLSCIILDLAMKGYIEIQSEGKGFKAKTSLIRKKNVALKEYLPFEEQLLFDELIDFSGPCVLDKRKGLLLESIRNKIENRFIIRRDNYTLGNESYVIPAVLLALALAVTPAMLYSNNLFVFVNIFFVMFFLISTGIVHNVYKKIIIGILNMLIPIICIYLSGDLHYVGVSITQLICFVGVWLVAFYVTLIRNVTPFGKKIFAQLNSFKKYIKTAEVNRVAASTPTDAQRIFCDYLPYAFAMDLHNYWMNKFSRVLSAAKVKECLESIGSIYIISHPLTNSIYAAIQAAKAGYVPNIEYSKYDKER